MTIRLRDWRLQIGTVVIAPGTGRHVPTVSFEVSKSTKREPNKARIEIMNLSDDRVEQLAGFDDVTVQLDAGYDGDDLDTIFLGDVRDLWTSRQTPDRVTRILAEDGGRSYRTASINRSFGPGTPVATVIQECATAMGVSPGNLAAVSTQAQLTNGGDNYATGTTLSGPAWRELSRVCSSCDVQWSIQNGVLQFRQSRRPAESRAVLLTPSTGLIGSPTRGEKDRRTRKVSYAVQSLLRPGLYPGRTVRVESKDLTANLQCKNAQYQGNTTGGDWYVNMDLEEYDA